MISQKFNFNKLLTDLIKYSDKIIERIKGCPKEFGTFKKSMLHLTSLDSGVRESLNKYKMYRDTPKEDIRYDELKKIEDLLAKTQDTETLKKFREKLSGKPGVLEKFMAFVTPRPFQ